MFNYDGKRFRSDGEGDGDAALANTTSRATCFGANSSADEHIEAR